MTVRIKHGTYLRRIYRPTVLYCLVPLRIAHCTLLHFPINPITSLVGSDRNSLGIGKQIAAYIFSDIFPIICTLAISSSLAPSKCKGDQSRDPVAMAIPPLENPLLPVFHAIIPYLSNPAASIKTHAKRSSTMSPLQFNSLLHASSDSHV